MGKQKLIAGATAFVVALAIPLWALSEDDSPSAGASGQVQATGESAGSATDEHAGHEAGDWQAMDEAMHERNSAFPAETEGVGGQAIEPEVLDDGTKRFTLTAQETEWEVEPGKVVDAISYNGMVPGPTIQVDVGDKVEVVLVNELPESTVIHWHGIPITNEMDGVADVTQPPVPPGESFTYEITASRQSVGWYHSHHNGAIQVADGLWGTFLIGDLPLPDGVEVTQEIPMQLQDSGAIGLSLNGKSFPATEALRVDKGDWILIHYVNAGTMPHPMHLHGLDQIVIAKDGFPLEQTYKADTVEVAPGERYSVLVQATQVGTWAFHCHIFPHSEGSQGMFGMFTELIVT